MDQKNNTTVYSPGKTIQNQKNMLFELWESRELIWRFFLREISSKYRQSFLGYIWAVIPALTTIFAASYVKNNGVINIGDTDNIDYPVYVLTTLTCWQIFSIGINKTTQCLAKSQAIITKINFCRETLVFAAFGESLFEFFIRLPILIGFFFWFNICPSWKVVFVPVILLLLSMFTLGLGFFLTLINGVFRDLANAMTLLLTFGMLLTPAIFGPYEGILNIVNPISTFIISIKDLTFYGQLHNPQALTTMAIISIALFLIGWRFFRTAIPRIAERV